MSLGRTFAAGAAAIVLLALGGVAVIRATEEAAPSVAPLAPRGPAPGVEPAAPLFAPAPAPANPEAPRPSGVMARDRMMQRRQVLNSFRHDLMNGFAALATRVKSCGARDASFTLELEAVRGAVRVEGARVDLPGSASRAQVACALSELRGQVMPAPGMESGRRWEVPFSAP